MSRVSKMSLEDIFNKTDLILRENDIVFFCDDIEVISKFISSYRGTYHKHKEVKEFLIENEESIDKERLLLLLVKNYKDNLDSIKNKKKELEKNLNSKPGNKEGIEELTEINIQEYAQGKNLEQALKLGKGMEAIITFYYYDEKEERYKMEVADSREIIDGKKVSKSKNLKRFEEIDKCFKGKESEEQYGIEYIIQSILLTDFYEIFPDAQFGDHIRTMILENAVVREGLKTREELDYLKNTRYKEYLELIDNTEFTSLLPSIKDTLKEYIQYVDIDKMLLISAYRFNEGLEEGLINPKTYMAAKEILEGILENIKNENTKISCTLQSKKDNSYDEQHIEYSVKDIKKCINQFTDKEYLTTTQIKEYRKQIKSRDISLFEINPDYVDVIYNEEELEALALLSDDNLKYVSVKLEWNNEKIIEAINNKNSCSTRLLRNLITNERIDSSNIIQLYMDKKIEIEQVDDIKDIIDLSEAANSYELVQYYYNSIEKDSSEEEKNKYDRYLELYKQVFTKDKTEEELATNSNKLIEAILDKEDNREVYIQNIERFYKEGLLSLSTLLDWDNEEIITRLYNNNLVNLEDIELLVKNNQLPIEYIEQMYKALVNDNNTSYDERLNYIKKGYVPENEIFRMYTTGIIFEKDLRELANQGIVRIEQVEKVINDRTKEDLEKYSSIKLTGLNGLTKINHDIYAEDKDEPSKRNGYKLEDSKAPKLIIDPNRRAQYINLFKAYEAETDLEEDSPFYNYEFYVIPDETGDIGLNSVVIAERYYEDKETEEKFALNNATYFFRYKDLMVLSNLKKSEMTRERDNVVFTAKHILADENKNGYWAAGVLYGIAKTMLSSDLKEYSKENQRKIILEKLSEVYSNDEILEILDMGSQIDSGEYTYEIEDAEDTTLRKRRKTNKTINDISDDSEAR